MKTRILSLLAIAALAVAACGGPSAAPIFSAPPAPNGTGTQISPDPDGTGTPTLVVTPAASDDLFARGLGDGAKLNDLDSYRFAWTGTAVGTDFVSGGSGTAINKPIKAVSFTRAVAPIEPTKSGGLVSLPTQYIVIGAQAWMLDGTAWITMDPARLSSVIVVGSGAYGDPYAVNLTGAVVGGKQMKNGIDCVRYTGGISSFSFDLWIATPGGYPVSGTVSQLGSGGFTYSFDITHVNDPDNQVSPPANVVATPT